MADERLPPAIDIYDLASAIAADVMGNDHLRRLLDEQQCDEVHGWVQEVAHRHISGRTAPASPTVSDEMVERAARMLADWIGYSWEGLREGRIGDRGFPQWVPSGNYQGGKQDLRDLAAALLAALGGHHD